MNPLVLVCCLSAVVALSVNLPKVDEIEIMEGSHFNARVFIEGRDEAHLNIVFPEEMYRTILEFLKEGKRFNADSLDNDLLEVASVFIKTKDGYYHRVCVFQKMNGAKAQFFSYEGKMYVVKLEENIDDQLLGIITDVEKRSTNSRTKSSSGRE